MKASFEHEGYTYSYSPMEGGEAVPLPEMLQLLAIPGLLRKGCHGTSYRVGERVAVVNTVSGIIRMQSTARHTLTRVRSKMLVLLASSSSYKNPPAGYALPTPEEVLQWVAAGGSLPDKLVWVASDNRLDDLGVRRVLNVTTGRTLGLNKNLHACSLLRRLV